MIGGGCTKWTRSKNKAQERILLLQNEPRDRLLQYEEHQISFQAESRKNEMINNFIKPSEDLAVSYFI